ncbi:flagellar hook-length control protein FliK [Halomonas koreensis]|uniref:Flagellar hook-length control protein FliK n=1 Tax=Halomonas koreensis TaxID=245385 RepID=A0ABU1G395_9GAMM|nr:flagellar hook-length control protein FliK [Halomonas koreensis]MDR5866914.1 flagellar hook-length control protein FliK [Halomonas koreensis]
MSGITPLIDTLLHQVLGKRVDVPLPKPLNQPIKPTAPAEAPRAVHSDSRLDARAPAPSAGEVARQRAPGGSAPASPAGAPPSSALTHLSASARTIADLLGRFPAPPSAVSPAAPLVAPGQAASPDQLAQHLQASIRDSGLFYEAHLARWFKGELPRQQLHREPQMLRTLHFTPLTAAATSTGSASGSASTASVAARVQAATPPVPFLPQAIHPRGEGMPPAAARAASAPGASAGASPAPQGVSPTAPGAPAPGGREAATSLPSPAARDAAPPEAARARSLEAGLEAPRPGGRETVHESLQHLVRHQLEMLATPSLRWEGDVWSGLFMALVIQLPQGRREGQGGEGQASEESRDEASPEWRSDLELEVAGIGPLKASLRMREARLDIELRAREAALARLEGGLEPLRHRLAAHGFDDVRLSLEGLPGEGA